MSRRSKSSTHFAGKPSRPALPASNKDGFLMSDEGNILLDVYFDGVQDIRLLNQTLLMMPGVVDTSLFMDILTGMILVNDKGVFKKERNGEFYAL